MKFHQIITSLIIAIAFIPATFSQTTTLSLSQLNACPGNQVTVSLTAQNLLNVVAITLYIEYDTNILQYLGHGNTDPQFPGVLSNAMTQPQPQVGIAWSNITPGSIINDTLMDLYFTFKNDSSWLNFNPDCEIVDFDLVPLILIPESGKVSLAPPYINDNPQNVTTTEGEDAIFGVTASGADAYQWQEWNGSVWTDLANNSIYQNVNTSQLIIVASPSALNNNWYRCSLSSTGGCQVYSDSAQLTILPVLTALLTLPDTLACASYQISVPLTGFGLNNIINFNIQVAFDPEVASFTGIVNANPLLAGTFASFSLSPVPHISLSWSSAQGTSIPDGELVSLVFDFASGITPLIIMNSSYITNADLLQFEILVQNGFITENPDPVILSSPVDTTVLSGNDVFFSTSATGAVSFQWFESRDLGTSWAMLDDVWPYSGTLSSQLLIHQVNTIFNLYKYKCLVTGSHCDSTTSAATLRVDTLLNTSLLPIDIPGQEKPGILSPESTGSKVRVTPNPFGKRATIEVALAEPAHVKVTLLNKLGQTLGIFADRSMDRGVSSWDMDFESLGLSGGTYFVRFQALGKQTATNTTLPVIYIK